MNCYFSFIIQSYLYVKTFTATLYPNQTSFIPTVTDNAFWQGLVPEHSIGIFFAPTGSMDGVTNGEIHFGGADSSKYTGELNYV